LVDYTDVKGEKRPCKDLHQIYGVAFFNDLPKKVRQVWVDMRFNTDYYGYRSLKKMIRVVKNRNYKEALKQMKISRWYTQVPNRADELIEYNGGLL
jgi:hypothetical protein